MNNQHKLKSLLLLSVMSLFTTGLSAQLLSKENTHDLDKRKVNTRNHGQPSQVIFDDATQKFQVIYTTNTKSKSIQVDKLTFDYDLNFVSEETEDIPLESGKGGKSDYTPNYRGDEYTIQGVTAGPNRAGRLEFQKLETSYKYNWFSGRYKKNVKKLDKVKFTETDKRKMTYAAHYDNPETGEVVAIAGQPDKFFQVKTYKVLRVNADLEKVSETDIEVGYVQRQMYAAALPSEDEAIASDFIMVFAAAGGKGVYKAKINADPNVSNWTYVRISPTGEVKEKINFDTKALNWMILGAQEKDGSVYVYGVGESKGVGEQHQKFTAVIGSGKQDLFQILKISDGKVDFISAPGLDEINAKNEKPASQKKPSEYSGKSVVFTDMRVTSTGDVFITAQDYLNLGTKAGPTYKDLFLFHFGPDGSFKRLYGIKNDQKNAASNVPTEGTIFEGSNGKFYWFLSALNDVYSRSWSSWSYLPGNVVKETTTTITIPLIQYKGGQMDIASGNLDDFSVFGNGEFNIFPKTPYIQVDGGKKMIFLGFGGKKGRQLWMGKFDPTTL